MKKPLIAILIVAAIALGFSASLVWFEREPIQLKAATWLGEQAKPLPEFELTDHFNKPFNNDRIKGKWHLLFFGYTHCPDICPETLQMLANTVALIKDDEVIKNLQVTFISVDPERDTLQKMKTYVTYFNPDFLSARADIDGVKKLTDALGILHYINKTSDSKIEVAHSGALTLIDPEGRLAGIFSSPHDSANIAHDLSLLING